MGGRGFDGRRALHWRRVVVELARRHPTLVGRAVLVGPTGDPDAAGVLGGGVDGWPLRSEPLSFNLLTVRELLTLGPRRMVNLVQR
jgi:pimeloyl-ACP methyl ester carboxylesterase